MVVVTEGMFPIIYSYVQATEPTDKTKGKFWYNTSNDSVYVSDGTNYNSLDTSNTYIIDAINQNRLQILINSIASSSSLNDYEDGIADIFTDANGTDNTIDTGNTTALFETDKYINGGNKSIAHGIPLVSMDPNAGQNGMKILCNANCNLISVNRYSGSTCTKIELWSESGGSPLAKIDEATFSGDVATFSTPPSLTATTNYYLVEPAVSSNTYYRAAGNTYPYNSGEEIEYTAGVWSGSESAYAAVVSSVVVTAIPTNKIIQSNALTIEANPTGIQFFTKNTIAGSGNVTFDYKIGSNDWRTGNALNSKIANTDTGSTITFKLNLNGVGAGNTVEIENYCGFLYSN